MRGLGLFEVGDGANLPVFVSGLTVTLGLIDVYGAITSEILMAE
jgi:hypothetical protein